VTANANLVRVSQDVEGDRFTITTRFVLERVDEAAASLRSGQQLMNIIALSSGEPTAVMVAALSAELRSWPAARGHEEELARRFLKLALAPSACTWGARA
jgi:hypothetical protein